jgi:hypothetical protein
MGLFFFLAVLRVELRVLGSCANQADTLALEPLHQPFFVLIIFEIGSHFIAWASLNHSSPICVFLHS